MQIKIKQLISKLFSTQFVVGASAVTTTLYFALKTKNIYVSGTSGMYPFLKFAQSTISLQPSSTGTSLSLKTIGTSDFRWHYGNLNFFY